MARTPNLVVKRDPQKHFTKDLSGGATSDRIILPGQDNCRVKVTKFKAPIGWTYKNISYDCDETVYVLSGILEVFLPDGSQVNLKTGDVYHVPAGVSYGVKILSSVQVLCVFSAGVHGRLPDDE